MTIALVSYGSGGAIDANAGQTGLFNSTGASLLVAVVASYALSPAPVVSGNFANTWASLTAYVTSARARLQILYVKNPTVGASHFVAANGTSSYPSLIVAAFSDTNTSANADQANGSANDSSLTLAPGSITPSEGNELIITGLGSDNTVASIGSGFTLIDSVVGAGFRASMAFFVQSAAAAVNPLWTMNSGGATDAAAAAIASFKSLGGGGAPPAVDESKFFALM